MVLAITAVTGQLGGEIVHALGALVHSDEIVGIARTPTKAQHLPIEVRPGDYNNGQEFEAALGGVEALLLIPGLDEPDKRIVQHRNVIQAAVAAGVKKIVYASVEGPEHGTAFSPVVQSNRQTEQDVQASGLAWVIGRNGIYIEPDVGSIESYKEKGEIANCAGDGKCGYTTRPELAYAYARLLTDAVHEGHTYNLHGEPITQAELAAYLSDAFDTPLVYRSMSVAEYQQDRVAEHGEFFGHLIAGIYEGIRNGGDNHHSDYAAVAGRPHQTWQDYFSAVKARQSAAI